MPIFATVPLAEPMGETVVEAEALGDELKEEAGQVRTQAQVELERLIAESQARAKEQGDAIAQLVSEASEAAQMIVQAAHERGLSIESESKRRTSALVEITRRQLESQIDEFSNQVQALNAAFETWEAATPPAPHAVLEGPLQLVIQAPLHLAGLGEVYECLLQLEDVTLRDTRESDDGSYVINFTLGNPTPLIDILSRLENVAAANAGPPPLHSADGDVSVLPAGAHGGAATRIVVRLE